MEQMETRQMSESFRLGAVLALAGGFLDAYTYLVRGGVFANAQTGNIVLLGIRLMEGDWAGAGHYLVPILAFAAGVLTAELVHARCGRWERLHWRQLTVAAEMILLVAVALLPGWADSGANVLVSYVCAVQVQSFRKVAGSAFATTMCTGNLRSGTEALYRGWLTGEREHLRRAGRYYGIIVFFCAGAALGAWCSGAWGRRAVLAASLLLFAAFLLMFRRKNTCGGGESGIK